MAEPRYSDERQIKVKSFADGKCSAESRRGLRDMNLTWFPTINGEFLPPAAGVSPSGFNRRNDAVDCARRFKDQCRQQLAETNGSM